MMSDIIYEISHSQLFLLCSTIALFCVGGMIFRRTRIVLLHPVLLTFVAVIFMLRALGVDYEEYRSATEILNFMLGMSVVALGYLMYEQTPKLKGSVLPITVSILVGCAVGVLSAVYIAKFLGAGRIIQTSIAPKSVTIPIAVSVAAPLHGEVSITSVVVFCVGLFGNMFGCWLLDKMHVTDPMARGLAMGSAAHGIGTAKAIEEGALQGAVSGLAMALMGIATALLLPLFERFCY